MFCGKCGKKINDGDSFCVNCGASVKSITSSKNIKLNNRIKKENKNVDYMINVCINKTNNFIERLNIDSQNTIKYKGHKDIVEKRYSICGTIDDNVSVWFDFKLKMDDNDEFLVSLKMRLLKNYDSTIYSLLKDNFDSDVFSIDRENKNSVSYLGFSDYKCEEDDTWEKFTDAITNSNNNIVSILKNQNDESIKEYPAFQNMSIELNLENEENDISIFDSNYSDIIKNSKCVIEYDEDVDPNNMDCIKIMNNEKIEKWLVLKKENDKALLIRKDILYFSKFKTKRWVENSWVDAGRELIETQGSWSGSDVQKYLNNEYFDKFDSDFKNRILETKKNDSVNNLNDKIFILSDDEYIKYFGKIYSAINKRIICRECEDDKISDVWCREVEHYYDDHMDIITESYKRRYIHFNDDLTSEFCSTSSCEDKGIRPAMWIKL